MKESDVALQLKETHQKIMQLMQVKIQEYGLTFGQLHLLMLVKKNPDLNQNQLALEMKFTKGAMSTVVKKLINLKLLEQIQLASDMRINRLHITDKGKSIIEDYQENLIKVYEDIFSGFDENQLIQLNDYLLLINNNLENMTYINKE